MDILRILVTKSSKEEKQGRFSSIPGIQEGKRNNWLRTAQLLPKELGPDGLAGKDVKSVDFISSEDGW